MGSNTLARYSKMPTMTSRLDSHSRKTLSAGGFCQSIVHLCLWLTANHGFLQNIYLKTLIKSRAISTLPCRYNHSLWENCQVGLFLYLKQFLHLEQFYSPPSLCTSHCVLCSKHVLFFLPAEAASTRSLANKISLANKTQLHQGAWGSERSQEPK